MTLPGWLQALAVDGPDAPTATIPAMIPPTDGSGRPAAVLMLFGDSPQGPSVLLLERASTLRQHAGQVAFPGGARDPGDADFVATALREAAEEVGLKADSVEVFGALAPLYLWVTEFVVTPVLGYWREPHPVSALDRAEVAAVAVIPIAELADPANRFTVMHPRGSTPGFAAGGLFIWGFTAMLLQTALRLGGWERPWDSSVERELPADAGTSAVVPASSEPSAVAGSFDP